MAININIPSQFRSYDDFASFPTTGSETILYVAKDTNKLYRWNGTAYVIVSPSEASSWGSITGNLASQLDLQAELDGKFDVPTGDTTQYLDGAGTPTTFPTTLSADKMVTIGRNSTGSTLYKGTIVYISGSTGNRPNFVKAKADIEATSAGTFGVIESDIANNADGNCVTIGTINNLDTRTSATHPFTSDTLADGDTIYLSPTTAGYITNVKPSAPDHLVYLGKVVRTSPTNGTIVYRVQNGYELEELHNVAISSVADNNIIQYDAATSLWKNESLSSAGIQPYLVSGLTIKTINSSSVLGSGMIAVQDPLVSGTNIKTIEGQSLLGSGNIDLSKSDVGLANVDNTSDANKPVSTATQTALDLKQNALTLTTTGTSGAATLVGSTLNIPQYSGGGGASGIHAPLVRSGSSVSFANTAVLSYTTLALSNGRIYAMPFIPMVGFTTASLFINVSTLLSGALARILIYSSSNNVPSAKLYESTDLDLSTVGIKTVTTSFTFTAGTTYFICLQSQLTALITAHSATTILPVIIGGVSAPTTYYYPTSTYAIGSAPTTFGSINSGNGNVPFIGITSA